MQPHYDRKTAGYITLYQFMKLASFCIILFFLFVKNTFSQTSNGEVSSLVAAENYFEGIAKEKGIRKALITVSDDETIIFRPGPVKALNYFEKQKADDSQLSWHPILAKISRSGDWGFTTGPYQYRSDENLTYGDYVSVWKMNNKGVWKLAIDMGISHKKPLSEPKLMFIDPKSHRFFRQKSEARKQQREDMILTSDILFSKTLEKYDNLAYNVFIADEARLLFPGHEPIIGKRNIADFLRLKELEIQTEPTKADRALGSDLAYTYGQAKITRKGSITAYHYMRIWEVQDGFKWNVILEIFTPAESEF